MKIIHIALLVYVYTYMFLFLDFGNKYQILLFCSTHHYIRSRDY